MKKYNFKYVRIGDTWEPWYDDDGERHDGGFTLKWAADGIGYGELTFYKKIDGCVCNTELMSKDFIEAALNYFINTIKLVDV